MKPLPKITIITPTFNQGRFIEETILSVINQKYPNLEYIIIDGGSTDNTLEIIEKYKAHISYWVSEPDSGQSNAINKGLKAATGSIINWLNSDDIMLPGCLDTIAGYFSNHPDIALVYGNIVYFNDNKKFPNRILKAGKLQYLSHICFPQPAAFFSKRMIDAIGFIDESVHFSMDWDLYVRANLIGLRFLKVPDIFCKFRIHNDSKTVSSFKKQFLIDNAFIFYSVVKSIQPSFKFIDTLYAESGIEIPSSYKQYNVSIILSNDDLKHMAFYFLEYRCRTLFFYKEYENLRHLVSVAKKYFPGYVKKSTAIRLRYLISKLPGFMTELILKLKPSRDNLLRKPK